MTLREQRILEIEIGLQKTRILKRVFWSLMAIGITTIAACVSYKTPTVYFGAVGLDASRIKVSDTEMDVEQYNTSVAFNQVLKQIRVMWQSYLMLRGLEFIGEKYYDHIGQELSSTETVKLTELKNAKDIKTAEIKLEELKLLETQP